MQSTILFNYYSIGGIIPFYFLLFTCVFLLSIKNKTGAAWHLFWVFFYMALFNLAYAFTASVDAPYGALHRWVTVATVIPAQIHGYQFFFHFPDFQHKRAARITFYTHYAVAIVATIYFISQTAGADRVFKTTGHYWDFDADGPSQLIGIIIFLGVMMSMVIGIFKAVVTPHKRTSLLAITGASLTATLVPAILNILSRDGAMDRGTFQIYWDLLNILGFFTWLIVFTNTGRDKSTFMAKIVGITLATFLLVLQFTNYFTLERLDEAFDDLRAKDTNLAARGEYSPSLQYLAVLKTPAKPALGDDALDSPPPGQPGFLPSNNPNATPGPLGEKNPTVKNMALGGLRFIKKVEGIASLKKDIGADTRNYHLLQQIYFRLKRIDAQGGPQAWRERAAKMVEKTPGIGDRSFAGYRQLLPVIIESTESFDEFNSAFHGFHRTLVYNRTKLMRLPVVDFKNQAAEFLKGKTGTFGAYAQGLLNNSDLFQGPNNDNYVYSNIGRYLQVIHPGNERGYRFTGPNVDQRFIIYHYYDRVSGRTFEAGYDYRSLRNYVHPTASIIMIILLGVVAFILFVFRLFFLGALVNPLHTLLDGVRRVNDGHLDVKVPIKVEDEIGFLSRSFNSMVVSIDTARKELQQHADHLEDRVKERTAELKKTLDDVQALKKQQDADYFLTSLLIQPLGANRVGDGDKVSIEFLTRQKKKFTFRHWESEIGGDLNKAHKITLMDRTCTVFMNADAMGKSMQGAGGALVLGAVFEAIIERTLSVSEINQVFPERWIKNAFIELHKVFHSFDGSMLVSVVFGVIDDENGMMYFINAEHPFPVIYRDRSAQFIGSEIEFRKLGTPIVDGTVHVMTFKLEPDDVVLIGSDGKDDLLLGIDEEGTRIINEDENLFLESVSEAEGDLERIFQSLLRRGELTDDLSLLRISYMGGTPKERSRARDQRIDDLLAKATRRRQNGNLRGAIDSLKEAVELDANNHGVLKRLIKYNLELGSHAEAAEAAISYTDIRPDDDEILYVASVCFRRLQDYQTAADLGERLRLRKPLLTKNNVNLARIYIKLDKPDRARLMVNAALESDAENEAAANLNAILDRIEAQKRRQP